MSKNSTNSPDWLDEASFDDEPSRLSQAIFFLLCAIPVLATIAYGAVDTWALGIFSLFSGTILILWLMDAWLKKEFFFSANLLQLPLLGLILIGLIQLLPLRNPDISGDLLAVPPVRSLSLDPYATRFFIIQLGIYFIFFAAALVFINNRKRLQKIVLTIIIFGAAMAFFGILQRLADTEAIYGIRTHAQAFPFASFVNQHHFAAFMEMTLGITLGLLFGRATKKDKRLLLIIAAILMGIALILTGSRGGMLSLLGVLAFLISANVLRRNKEQTEIDKSGKIRRNLALIGSGLALVFILFGSVLLLGEDQSLVRGIGISSGAADFSSGRLHFWQTALQIFLNNPIIGAGLDAFGVAYTRYDTWSGVFRVERAHNDYLQILTDAGILGFACITTFIYLLFRQSLQTIGKTHDNFRRSISVGALAGCFGILIHSFFDFPLRTPSNGFFFLILVVLAVAPISYRKVSAEHN